MQPQTFPQQPDSVSAATAPTRVVPIVVRGGSVKLSIPLDDRRGDVDVVEDEPVAKYRRPRRDSLERREALLKGREGSRRRQRWENDRLMNNPWAQPPQPNDWQVMPTHPVRVVPYFLAPLWEERLAARREEDRERRLKLQKQRNDRIPGSLPGTGAAQVTKELRSKLKRTKAAKGLLYDLEEDIRSFVATWQANNGRGRGVSFGSAVDVNSNAASEDSEDDIIFVGRNGESCDDPPSPKVSKTREDMVLVNNILAEKLVFGARADDHGAKFGRWLVHSIAQYYGLIAWSVTRGIPAHRDAYVGIDRNSSNTGVLTDGRMPTPLWGLV